MPTLFLDFAYVFKLPVTLNVFLTVHHELIIYWLPTWCTNYYLFI